MVKTKAADLGFVACGIAPASLAPHTTERLRAWIADGAHGEMIWMESRADQRAQPRALWPAVNSVIALGMSYAPAGDPLALASAGERGRISVARLANLLATPRYELRPLFDAHGIDAPVTV